MGKNGNLCWTSALIGAAAVTASAAIFLAKPRRPAFRLISLSALRLNLLAPRSNHKPTAAAAAAIVLHHPVLVAADLILNVHVTNPNILPVRYSPTSLSIFYDGSLLGVAAVPAGSQPARSCNLLRLPARLDGLELAHHAKRFLADVARREMVLDAKVDICGTAKALWWDHKFKVHVDSHIVLDPVFLDVIDQENVSQLKMFAR